MTRKKRGKYFFYLNHYFFKITFGTNRFPHTNPFPLHSHIEFESPVVGNDNDCDHHRNLGHVGKIETLLIFPICRLPSQTIGDVYDSNFH